MLKMSTMSPDTSRETAKSLSYPLAFDAPFRGRGSRQNIVIPFGVEKLEWWD